MAELTQLCGPFKLLCNRSTIECLEYLEINGQPPLSPNLPLDYVALVFLFIRSGGMFMRYAQFAPPLNAVARNGGWWRRVTKKHQGLQK